MIRRELKGWSRTADGVTVGPCGNRFLWFFRCRLWTGHDGDHIWNREKPGSVATLMWKIEP